VAKVKVPMKATTQQKGKGAEFLVFSELVKRGADVYLPIIDVGIDAILRLKTGTYLEIQVKSTEVENQAGYFNVSNLELKLNPFIVCVDMSEKKMERYKKPEVWILPSTEFRKYATKIEEGYRLPLPEKDTRHGNIPREEILERYCANKHEAWKILIPGPVETG